MFGLSLPPVVCRRAHVLFTLFVFVCVCWCPTHTVLCFCFVFHRLVYPMLPVSLDCPFLIAPSIFSDIYFQKIGCNGTHELKIEQLLLLCFKSPSGVRIYICIRGTTLFTIDVFIFASHSLGTKSLDSSMQTSLIFTIVYAINSFYDL